MIINKLFGVFLKKSKNLTFHYKKKRPEDYRDALHSVTKKYFV